MSTILMGINARILPHKPVNEHRLRLINDSISYLDTLGQVDTVTDSVGKQKIIVLQAKTQVKRFFIQSRRRSAIIWS